MPAFQHQRFCGRWHLITANINKESAVDVDHTVTRILSPEIVRADLPVILALQETRSWDVEEMHVPGLVIYENVSGLTTLIVSDRLCKVQRTWRSEERCAAVLFRFTRVMSVYAPDSGKDHEDYENSRRERRKFYCIDDGMGPNVSTLRSTSTSSWVCCV